MKKLFLWESDIERAPAVSAKTNNECGDKRQGMENGQVRQRSLGELRCVYMLSSHFLFDANQLGLRRWF